MVPLMASRRCPVIDLTRESGQPSLLLIGVLAALLAGTLILFGWGQALGARAKHQRAADLAAISAAQVMRDLYPRLFEPPFLEPDVPNPRHLEQAEYLELAREAALRGGAGTDPTSRSPTSGSPASPSRPLA